MFFDKLSGIKEQSLVQQGQKTIKMCDCFDFVPI